MDIEGMNKKYAIEFLSGVSGMEVNMWDEKAKELGFKANGYFCKRFKKPQDFLGEPYTVEESGYYYRDDGTQYYQLVIKVNSWYVQFICEYCSYDGPEWSNISMDIVKPVEVTVTKWVTL